MDIVKPPLEPLYRQAEQAWQGGDWDQALGLCLEFLQQRLASRSALNETDRLIIERAADLAVPLGMCEGADRLLAALALDCERSGNRIAADYATLKRAHLALGDGQLDSALARLQELEPRIGPLRNVPTNGADLDSWESACWQAVDIQARSLLFSRLYLELGRWLANQGYYGQAILLLERGVRHAQPPASSFSCRAFTPLQLAVASAQLEMGELAAAKTTLTSLGNRIDQDRQPGQAVHRLELWTRYHLLQGQFGPGLECLSGCVEICRRGGFRRPLLSAILNRANVLILVNQLHNAETTLSEASALSSQLGDRTALQHVVWLQGLARARAGSLSGEADAVQPVTVMWKGRHTAEAPFAESSTNPLDLPQASSYLAMFEFRALAVQWAQATGNLGAAVALLRQLEAVFKHSESMLIRARLHLLISMVCYDLGQYAESARLLEVVVPELELRGLKHDLWQARRAQYWCAVRLEKPSADRDLLAERSVALQDDLANSLSGAERAIFLLNKWTAEEWRLAKEVQQLGRAREIAVQGSRWLRLWRWRRIWRCLNSLLHRLDQQRRLLTRQELAMDCQGGEAPPSLWQRFWRHSRLHATVSFLVLPDRVLVCRVSWFGMDFVARPLTRVRLRELVATWHRCIAENSSTAHAVAEELAAALRLSELLDDLPKHVEALTIIPDDALHGFPFAALLYHGQPLFERFVINIAFDRSTSPPVRENRPLRRALTVASTREASPQCGLPLRVHALPGARKEVLKLTEWLRDRGADVCCLMDGEADRASLLEHLETAEFAHIACHGVFVPDRPDASGLILAPKANQVEVLTLRHLATLRAGQLRHITLSNCWSADNFVLPGRSVISLPETLWRGGAKSVLACLWPVNDEVGQAFSARYYEHLANMTRAEALRATQQDCLHNRLPVTLATDNAFFWAGYQLYGDGGPLLFRGSQLRVRASC